LTDYKTNRDCKVTEYNPSFWTKYRTGEETGCNIDRIPHNTLQRIPKKLQTKGQKKQRETIKDTSSCVRPKRSTGCPTPC
jgi:hypothetical protein